MKNNDKLTHNETITALTDTFRDIAGLSPGDRNAMFHISKGKAIAQIVTAIHREEVFESKRQQAMNIIKLAEQPTVKKLKSK